MFGTVKHITASCKGFINLCEIQHRFLGWHWRWDIAHGGRHGKFFHTSDPSNKLFRKEGKLKVRTKSGNSYEVLNQGKVISSRIFDLFPDENLGTKLFGEVMFKDLPIIHIHVTENNTIMNLTNAKGVTKLVRSCGMDGFQNAKKGTNLAAQTTAVAFAHKAMDLGYKTVRVKIQGLGPGRQSSIKGLSISGMDIISITDATPVSDNPPRAKKLKRV